MLHFMNFASSVSIFPGISGKTNKSIVGPMFNMECLWRLAPNGEIDPTQEKQMCSVHNSLRPNFNKAWGRLLHSLQMCNNLYKYAAGDAITIYNGDA